MRTLSKITIIPAVISVVTTFSLLSPQPTEAQAQVIKQRFDLPFEDIFRAADGCLTEDVHVLGTLPTQSQTAIDAKGGLHVNFHQVARLKAVGLSTGDTYHTQGPLAFVAYDFDGTAPREIFFHNMIQLIGPKKDGNLNVHILFHAVFDASGVQTVDVNKVDIVCH